VPGASKKIAIFLAVIIGVASFVYVKTDANSSAFVPPVWTLRPVPTGPARSPQPRKPPVKYQHVTPVHFATVNKIWIIGLSAIQQLEQHGASTALIKHAFDNNHTFVYGDTPHNRYPPSPIGVPTLTYSSYAGIQAAFADGTLPGRYKAVLYDNEHWPATPSSEQKHPAHYEQLVAQLLHKHGLLYIATPAPDLTMAVGKVINTDSAFLKAKLPAITARYADILDLQAQFHEANVGAYRSFVQAAAAQARAANHRITIVIGIRTNPGNTPMLTAYKATASLGSGYWINVNGIPSPAVYLLHQLYLASQPPPARLGAEGQEEVDSVGEG
jgi:hypothetical protein